MEVVTRGGAAITLDELKKQLRLRSGYTSQDPQLTSISIAATEMAENYCHRLFVTGTVKGEIICPGTTEVVRLAWGTPIAITELKSYREGEEITYATNPVDETKYYIRDTDGIPYLVPKKALVVDPDYDSSTDQWIFKYTAGYGAIGDVPAIIKQVILQIATQMYERPEGWDEAKYHSAYCRILDQSYRFS